MADAAPLTSLVRLAVEDDDSERLLAAAADQLGGPLGLAGPTGAPLAHAPDDDGGQRALAVARTAATSMPGEAAPGWRVVPVSAAASRLALLAVGPGRGGERAVDPLLDVLVPLLGEQLLRAGLRRNQTGAFLRRLVTQPGMPAERARAEAAPLGLVLPDALWPAVLSFGAPVPEPGLVERVERDARRLSGGLTVAVSGHIVLLHTGADGGPDVMRWLEQVVAQCRSAAPSIRPQAVAAEGAVVLGELSGQVARLVRLSGYGRRGEPSRAVVGARQYALDRLLGETLTGTEAGSFVDDLVGGLIAWDREHRSDLLGVLEAALDHPRLDQAAERCFMHRNTFRVRLRKAQVVLGDELDDPDVRLAVHVALKLHRAGASRPASRESPAARRNGGRRRPGRPGERRIPAPDAAARAPGPQ
jgi:hypothetical protein